MVGKGRITSRGSRLSLLLAGLAAATLGVLATSATALTAHTNRGGKCVLRATASRSGGQISYGIKVHGCSTKFGVRYVVSRGILYDQSNGEQPVRNGYLRRRRGNVPYTNRRRVDGTNPGHTYRTRLDVSVVLKTRRKPSTRKPERWHGVGKRCHVKTTDHDGDTLGCELGAVLRGA
jgi:hypothetical protein